MADFDRSMTVSAPPTVVTEAIRRVISPTAQLPEHGLFFARTPEGLWQVWHVQTSSPNQVIVRHIVTTLPRVNIMLQAASDLAKALDGLKRNLTPEAEAAAGQRMEEVKQSIPTLMTAGRSTATPAAKSPSVTAPTPLSAPRPTSRPTTTPASKPTLPPLSDSMNEPEFARDLRPASRQVKRPPLIAQVIGLIIFLLGIISTISQQSGSPTAPVATFRPATRVVAQPTHAPATQSFVPTAARLTAVPTLAIAPPRGWRSADTSYGFTTCYDRTFGSCQYYLRFRNDGSGSLDGLLTVGAADDSFGLPLIWAYWDWLTVEHNPSHDFETPTLIGTATEAMRLFEERSIAHFRGDSYQVIVRVFERTPSSAWFFFAAYNLDSAWELAPQVEGMLDAISAGRG